MNDINEESDNNDIFKWSYMWPMKKENDQYRIWNIMKTMTIQWSNVMEEVMIIIILIYVLYEGKVLKPRS